MKVDLVEFFKALSDETRLRIINLLLRQTTLHVNEISDILSLPQSKVSRHLAVLRRSGWLIFQRRDKWIYYRMNPDISPEFLNSFRYIFKDNLQFETDLKAASERP